MMIRVDKNNLKLNDPRKTELYKNFASNLIKAVGCCQICKSNVNLQMHHVLPVSLYPHLIVDINNVVVLCSGIDKFSGCHKKHGHLGDFSKYNINVKSLCK